MKHAMILRALAPLLALLSSACGATRGAQGPVPVATGWEVIGESREGREVRARDLGAGDGPRLALIVGIHGDEQEGLRHLDELVAWADALPARVRLYEDLNPDGTAAGTRTNSAGVDPNRNWPARNFEPAASRGPRPLSEPAIAGAHADLVRFDPELVVVLHSTRRGPFVNYDGPAEAYAQRFAEAAESAAGGGWRVVPDMGYETPGSFGSWMGKDRGVPTLTVELRRGCAPSASGPALRAGLAALLGSGGVARAPEGARDDAFRVR